MSKHMELPGQDCLMRMNFLYQASMLMANQNTTLSAHYGQIFKSISKKAVLRSDPDIKRDFCKRCCLAQKPGITAELNIKTRPSRRKRKYKKCKSKTKQHETEEECKILDENAVAEVICNLCKSKRNFHINKDYDFWLENPDSIAQIYTLNEENKVIIQKKMK